MVIDSQLTLAAHVSSSSRVSYFQLQQLRPVARSLSAEAVKSLVQAFISCRLDYCNAMFTASATPCSCSFLDRSSATRPHFTGSEATSLAASTTPSRVQAGRHGIQVVAEPNPAVPARRRNASSSLTTWTMSSPFRQRQHMHRPEDQYSIER